MFNLKDIGDMAQLANQAKQLQAEQQKTEKQKIEILAKISETLDDILSELKKK